MNTTRRALLGGLAGSFALPAESAALRDRFLKMIDRPRVPAEAEVRLLERSGGLEIYHLAFRSEAGQAVPGIFLKSEGAAGKLPVVIVLHGTGGTKEGQLGLLKQFAAKGFLSVAIDGRYHGERTKARKGSAEYVAAMLRRYQTGKEYPFLYDTVWDVMRLIDYLSTRPDVDAKRIGAIGFSKGGMELYLAAAADPRIRAAVPCIGVQSFRWAIEHDAWQSRVGTFQAAADAAAKEQGEAQVNANVLRAFYDRVAPGVYSEFDGPKMVPLIAPRPLLVINGDSDARTPRPGLMECIDAARAAYGDSRSFRFVLQEKTGHKVNPDILQSAVDWLATWLSAEKN
ncbi:MAG: acetylxylan esterase [Acidobacteria bacterium]|nr:acetylxylan esterase [Acidobacteriota bacterium]